MGALSNIPSHAVLPLGAYDEHSLTRAARQADQTLLTVDLCGARDREAVFAQIAKAFSLPAHFGHNLDALYDSVTDMKPSLDAEQPGFFVVLKNLPDTESFGREDRDALLDVFREAADYFFDRGTAFRVFYSVGQQAEASRTGSH
ncbi:MAG: barstar family protein [Limnobacter sp.]|nr:barstar family protein [Limnobacter sp.]